MRFDSPAAAGYAEGGSGPAEVPDLVRAMAFRDFSFPEVQQALGLTLAEADLFGAVPAVCLPAAFPVGK